MGYRPKNQLVFPWNRVIGLTALAGIIFLIGFLLLEQTQPVTAQDILVRATEASTNAAFFGVDSYQGVIKASSPTTEYQYFVWYAAPHSKRVEYFSSDPAGRQYPPDQLGILGRPTIEADKAPVVFHELDLSNGVEAWSFDNITQIASRVDPDLATLFISTTANGYFDSRNRSPQVLSTTSNEAYNIAKLIGTETVAGRPVYLVEIIPQAENYAVRTARRIVVKIDQQTYLQLGIEVWGDYSTVLYRQTFETFTLNRPIAPDIFTYTPPGSVKVAATAIAVARPSPNELQHLWTDLANREPFTLYTLQSVPQYLHPKGPIEQVQPGNAPAVQQIYRSETPGSTLIVMETQNLISRKISFPGKTINVGPYEGHYLTNGNAHVLHFIRKETILTLVSSSDIGEDTLINIAQSFQEIVKPNSR